MPVSAPPATGFDPLPSLLTVAAIRRCIEADPGCTGYGFDRIVVFHHADVEKVGVVVLAGGSARPVQPIHATAILDAFRQLRGIDPRPWDAACLVLDPAGEINRCLTFRGPEADALNMHTNDPGMILRFATHVASLAMPPVQVAPTAMQSPLHRIKYTLILLVFSIVIIWIIGTIGMWVSNAV